MIRNSAPLCLVAANVSPRIADECNLTYIPERRPICNRGAALELDEFCGIVSSFGVNVVRRRVPDELPDGVFKRDTARVFDGALVLASMTRESRRPEVAATRQDFEELANGLKIWSIFDMNPEARLEFGDTVVDGEDVFVCESTRTNAAGINCLAEILNPIGCRVIHLGILPERLHLDMALSSVGERTLLLDPNGAPRPAVNGAATGAKKHHTAAELLEELGYTVLITPEGEGAAAACFRMRTPRGNLVIMRDGFPRTHNMLMEHGVDPVPWCCTELSKAESGPDCIAIEFHPKG